MANTNILDLNNRVSKLEKKAGSGGGGTADDVTYDNTDSHLEATNVQDAIDELSGEIAGMSADDVSYDGTDSGLSAVTVQSAIDEVVSALGGSNLTDITDWVENTSYPSGTALPSGTWTWIGHKILQPGIYYISCGANLLSGTTNATSMMQQIRDLTHDKVLTADSFSVTQRYFYSSCIVALTETTDIYFDVYVGGSAVIHARAFHAIKLF